ncbi:MAG: laccase domain-containing protein [Patescibacteria group bacterium]
MIRKSSISEEDFFSFKLTEKSICGMTYKSAGNFWHEYSSEKSFEFAKKVLELTGFDLLYLFNRLIVMRAETHSDKVICFSKPNNLRTNEFFGDGAIYYGPGAAVFFPGGCPAIAFRDEEANLSGLLHGGWKPITQGILEKFLKQWEKSGGKSHKTLIKFLPSICPQCLIYERKYFVSKIVPHLVTLLGNEITAQDFYSHVRNKARHRNETNFYLDFLIERILRVSGYQNLELSSECTCCSEKGGKYWCYRHDDNKEKRYRSAAFLITAV